MTKEFIAEVVISEIDTNGGTGRDKDERTTRIERAKFTVRGAELEALKARVQSHIELVE